MAISKQQISHSIGEQLMLFQEGSPVSRSVMQGREKEQQTIAISGRKCLEQLEKFNRVGSWAKMFAGLLIGRKGWYSTRCRLIWKLKATKCCRFYFQLAVLGRHTNAIECGLWQTPTVSDSAKRVFSVNSRGEPKLSAQAKIGWPASGKMWMLPTPTAHQQSTKYQQGGICLQALLTDGKNSQLNPRFVEEMMGFPIGWTDLRHLETQ